VSAAALQSSIPSTRTSSEAYEGNVNVVVVVVVVDMVVCVLGGGG